MTVRVVVIGTGRFGQHHAACIDQLDDAELAGVVDTDAERARAVAGRHGSAWSTDLAQLVSDTSPDAAIVATPGHTHLAVARQLLSRRIPVLIEKPVGMTPSEVGQIADAAGDVPVLAGHVLRFSSTHRWAHDVARSGVLGRITSLRSMRHRDNSHLDAYPDIDIVRMTMVHDIDLAYWITGPAELAVVRAGPTRGHEILAVGVTEGGAAWSLTTGWTLPAGCEPADRLEILGERGFVVIDAAAGTSASPGVPDAPAPDSEAEMLRREVEHFLECVRTGTASEIITLADVRAVVQIAETVWSDASRSIR